LLARPKRSVGGVIACPSETECRRGHWDLDNSHFLTGPYPGPVRRVGGGISQKKNQKNDLGQFFNKLRCYFWALFRIGLNKNNIGENYFSAVHVNFPYGIHNGFRANRKH
jgi:hypothetical protein